VSTVPVGETSRPPTVQAFVLAELRKIIIAGELKPGQAIRQESIAERFGVSRAPVREALKILEGESQVVHRPHHGYMVAELSLADLLEVYHIRGLLESEATRLAIEKFTDDDLEQIVEAQHEAAAASAQADLLAMTAANRRFHFVILETSRMPRLTRIIRSLWDSTDAYRSIYYKVPSNREQVEHEHAEIVDAVRHRDGDRLVKLLAEHRDHAVEALSRIISDEA
jgi:DNA-binding GntR family transcriptional regulator